MKVAATGFLVLGVGLGAVLLACEVTGGAGNLLAEGAGLSSGLFLALTVVGWLERRRWRRVRGWTLIAVRESIDAMALFLPTEARGAAGTLAERVKVLRRAFDARVSAASGSFVGSGGEQAQGPVGLPEVVDLSKQFEPGVRYIRQAGIPQLMTAGGPEALVEGLIRLDAAWHTWTVALEAGQRRVEGLATGGGADPGFVAEETRRVLGETLELGEAAFDALESAVAIL